MRRRLLRLASEVRSDHRRVLRDRCRRAIGNLSAEVENGDVAADAHHQPHVVVDEQDGQAVLVELLDQRPYPVLLGRVHSRGRLIEDQQMRIERERSGDLEPSLVAVGQGRRLPVAELVRVQADTRQQLTCLLPPATVLREKCGNRNQLLQRVVAPPEMHAGEHVLDHCQVAVKPKRLECARDAEPGDGVRRPPSQFGSPHPTLPRRRGRG